MTGDGEFEAEGMDNITDEWMIFDAGKGGSLLMMDHPENLRSPTKWYVAPMMPYFSPALLFDASHSLAADEVLTLRHRIVVSPEPISLEQASNLFRDWIKKANIH